MAIIEPLLLGLFWGVGVSVAGVPTVSVGSCESPTGELASGTDKEAVLIFGCVTTAPNMVVASKREYISPFFGVVLKLLVIMPLILNCYVPITN